LGHVQVSPGVCFRGLAGLGDDVALQEDALGNASIFNAALNDVQGVVFEVVVDDALANTVVLIGVFNDGLLEVGVKLEDLKGRL